MEEDTCALEELTNVVHDSSFLKIRRRRSQRLFLKQFDSQSTKYSEAATKIQRTFRHYIITRYRHNVDNSDDNDYLDLEPVCKIPRIFLVPWYLGDSDRIIGYNALSLLQSLLHDQRCPLTRAKVDFDSLVHIVKQLRDARHVLTQQLTWDQNCSRQVHKYVDEIKSVLRMYRVRHALLYNEEFYTYMQDCKIRHLVNTTWAAFNEQHNWGWDRFGLSFWTFFDSLELHDILPAQNNFDVDISWRSFETEMRNTLTSRGIVFHTMYFDRLKPFSALNTPVQ